MIITSFGRSSDRPLRKSIILLVSVSAIFLATGIYGAGLISKAGLIKNMPSSLMFTLLASIVFIIVSFTVLPIVSFLDSRHSISSRNLKTLPLSRTAIWYVKIAPLVVVGLLISQLCGSLLVGLSRSTATNLWVVLASYILGLSAAIGFAVANAITSSALKYLSYVGLSVWLLYLAEIMVKSSSQITYRLAASSVIVTLSICALGIVQRFYFGDRAEPLHNSSNNLIKLPNVVMSSAWFFVKFGRNRKSLSSLIFCLIIAAAVLISSQVRQAKLISASGAILFAAVLATSLACDARGISRRYKPPEIMSLNGVGHFVNAQSRALVVINSLVAAPLIVYLVSLRIPDLLSHLIYMTAIIVAGTMIGLLFSTFFVPGKGEVGAQFSAGILAVFALFLSPRILKFSTLSPGLQSLSWLCLAGACYLAIIIIEEVRKKGYGHVR
ncbi:MAG: hypothetical protein ACXWLH_03220 [Candidatus Saccharimonadales bacterium]